MKSSFENTMSVNVRPAIMTDAPIVARAVCMAIGHETMLAYCGDDYLSVMTALAKDTATQYSYCHALVAEIDGKAVGAALGYDGASLAQLRNHTLQLVEQLTGRKVSLEDETQAGEFYIDTVGVLPDYRGNGIGTQLLQSIIDFAFQSGFDRVGLLVDFDNPRAQALYTSLGFVRQEEKDFLGHRMWHMQITIACESTPPQ